MGRQVVWLAVVWVGVVGFGVCALQVQSRVEGWVHLVVLLAFLLATATSCPLSQTQQKSRSWMVDRTAFEARVHSRLDSVVLEGCYILASLLGPSSGVGTRQMWMQALHRQAVGLQLEPHS